MGTLKKIIFFAGAILGGGLAGAYAVFRKQRYEQIQRLSRDSRLINTNAGLIEFAEVGKGPAVLVMHGAGAGYDMGLLFDYQAQGLRTIAPSRPGYLRTPLETGLSPAEQADAFAALLDELGIDQAAVIGASAGGPPALEFAIRYPERTWALVLISALNQPLKGLPPSMDVFERVMPTSDFIPWLMLNTPLAKVISPQSLEPVDPSYPGSRGFYERLARTMFPISPRVQGVFNDMRWNLVQDTFDFDEITAPTLVIHGVKDSIVPFSHGELSARAIKGAQFKPVPGGDHLCYFTHQAELEPLVVEFLKKNAPGKG